MKTNKSFIFEKIRVFHLPYLLYLLLRGYQVSVFNFAAATGEFIPGFLKKFIDNKKISYINLTMIHPHGLAIDLTDSFFDRMSGSHAHKMAAKIFRDEEAKLIFKKSFVNDIFKCIYIHEHLDSLSKENKRKHTYFIPDQYLFVRNLLNRYGSAQISPSTKTSIVYFFETFFVFTRFLQRFFYILVGIGFFLLKLTAYILPSRSAQNNEKLCYKYGISINSEYFIKYKGKRGFDFLLDGKGINIKNTVFLIPHSLYEIAHIKKRVNQYKSEGFNFYVLPDNRSLRGLIGNLTKISRFFTFSEISRVFLENKPFAIKNISVLLKSCFVFFQFKKIFSELNIEKYVYSNQEGWSQIAFNIFVRNKGISTWNYSSFIGGAILYATDSDFSKVRHILWSYLNSEYFLAVNDNVVSYYKLHSQKTRHYLSIGSIYSEMVGEHTKENKSKRFLNDNFPDYKEGRHKVVTYFDTTFIDDDNVITSFDDGIDSCRDMLQLLRENDNIFLIFKPSKNENFYVSPGSPWSSPLKGQQIIDLWTTLRVHPRVFWAGDEGDVTLFIAASDLVITHCMSSPTLDALGSRKRAIWYESGNKHRGILYDQIPNLVCHGYKDLKEKVDQLLFQTTDKEYNDYLDRNIYGALEPHLDNQGLSRLRLHLSGKN